MDGKNHGKPYEQMDDLGGGSHIFGGPPICVHVSVSLNDTPRGV